jgi:hypothetical protein
MPPRGPLGLGVNSRPSARTIAKARPPKLTLCFCSWSDFS